MRSGFRPHHRALGTGWTGRIPNPGGGSVRLMFTRADLTGCMRPGWYERMQVPGAVHASAAAEQLAAVLKVVANPVRLRILMLLAAEQLCVCHLQDALGVRQTLTSHHLRALRDAGLVETEPCGRFVYYRLRAGVLDAARDALGVLADASTADLPKRAC